MPNKAIMRIKSRNKVLNLPLRSEEVQKVLKEDAENVPLYSLPGTNNENQKELLEPGEIPN